MSDSHVLEVGNEVSARYRGAFCEATIKQVKKNVKVRVSWNKPGSGSATIAQDNIKGELEGGKQVEAKHSDGSWYPATILKVTDASTYTVVFDDGDERTLGRNSVCPQGAKHFNEDETLDHLPLTNPENFGTPVILDSKKQRKRRKVDTPSLSLGSVQYSGEDIGKVIFYDGSSGGGDRRKQHLVPCLISSQSACDEFIPTNPGEIIVRSFKAGRFLSIPKEDMYQFDRGTEPLQSILFNAGEYTVMKPALEKALAYYDTGVLPLSWQPSWDPQNTSQSDPEPLSDARLRKRFNNALQDFWNKKGCPIQRQPSIGYHDLDLYTLYNYVKDSGGPDKVTQDMKWRSICAQMKILNIPPNGSNTVKNAYYKHVAPFVTQWEGRGKRKKSTGPKICDTEALATPIVLPLVTTITTSTRRSTPTPRVSTPIPRVTTPTQLRRSSMPNLVKCEDAVETESVESESSNNTTEHEGMPDIHEYRVGQRVKVLYGVAKMCGSYEAKIVDRNIDSRDNTPIYYIHYAGWNTRYDEWIAEESILCQVTRSAKKKGVLLEPPKDIRVIPNRRKIIPKFHKSKKQRRCTSETSSTEDKNSLPSEDTSDPEPGVEEKGEGMEIHENIIDEIKIEEIPSPDTDQSPDIEFPAAAIPLKTSPLICNETIDELEDDVVNDDLVNDDLVNDDLVKDDHVKDDHVKDVDIKDVDIKEVDIKDVDIKDVDIKDDEKDDVKNDVKEDDVKPLPTRDEEVWGTSTLTPNSQGTMGDGCGHPENNIAVEFDVSVKDTRLSFKKKKMLDLKKANWEAINSDLHQMKEDDAKQPDKEEPPKDLAISTEVKPLAVSAEVKPLVKEKEYLKEPPKEEEEESKHLAKEEAAAILMAFPTFQINSSTTFQQHLSTATTFQQQHVTTTTTPTLNASESRILFKSPSPQFNISPPQPVTSAQFSMSPPGQTLTAPQYTTSPRQPISSPRHGPPSSSPRQPMSSPRHPSSSPRHSKAYQFSNLHSAHSHSVTSPHSIHSGASPHSTHVHSGASPHSATSPRGAKSPPKMVKMPVQRNVQPKTDYIISDTILHSQIGAIIKLEESDSLESKKNRRKRKIQQADSTSDMGSRLQQFEFTPDPTEDNDKRTEERPKRTERDKARRGTVKNSDMGPFKLTTTTKPPELASLSDADKRKDGRGLDRMSQQPPYWIPSSVIGSHGYLRSNYPLYYGGSDLIQGGYYVPMRPPGMGPYPPGYMPRFPVPLLTRDRMERNEEQPSSSSDTPQSTSTEDTKPPLPDSTVSDEKTPPHRYMDSDSSEDRQIIGMSPLGPALVNNSMSECSDKEGTPGPKIPIFDKDFTVKSFDHLEEQDRIKAIQHAMAEMQRCYGMLKGEVATIDKKDRQKRKSKERDRKKGKQKTPKKDPERAQTTSPEKT